MDRPIHLSVTTDRSYLPHVATMLHSAQDAPEQPPLVVHLLHDGRLGGADLRPLEAQLARRGDRLVPAVVDPERVRGLSSERFSITAWFRILLPDLVDDVERIVHVDGDALVCRSLAELRDTDLGGRPFGAVQNPLYPWMTPAWKRLGLGAPTPYLNSGVMVLDLPRMRAAGAPARLVDYGVAHPENPYPEQDALSVVFADGWHELHPRWNLQTTLIDLAPRYLPFDHDDVVEARRAPGIVHFSGPFKPWDGWGASRWIRAYHRHRAGTGYPDLPFRRRRLTSRVAPLTPMRLRRRLLLRAIDRVGRD